MRTWWCSFQLFISLGQKRARNGQIAFHSKNPDCATAGKLCVTNKFLFFYKHVNQHVLFDMTSKSEDG